MENRKPEGKNQRVFWAVVAIACAAVVFICLLIVFREQRDRAGAEALMEELQEGAAEESAPQNGDAAQEEPSAGPQIDIPDKRIDFEALMEENEDIYAWIYVPGTDVDYPVLQHPTDDSYYLNHNIDGSKGYPGCIYSESLNAKDFTDNHTVFYGHNMDDDTMFGSLHVFEDEDVFAEDHYIYVYTPERVFVYQIFAAYEYPAIHLLYNFDMEDDAFFAEYLEGLSEIQGRVVHVRDDIPLSADDRILTLSTCTTDHEDSLRFLVQGVLVDEEE